MYTKEIYEDYFFLLLLIGTIKKKNIERFLFLTYIASLIINRRITADWNTFETDSLESLSLDLFKAVVTSLTNEFSQNGYLHLRTIRFFF